MAWHHRLVVRCLRGMSLSKLIQADGPQGWKSSAKGEQWTASGTQSAKQNVNGGRPYHPTIHAREDRKEQRLML